MRLVSYNYVSGIYYRACHLCYVIHYYTTTADYDCTHVAVVTVGCIYSIYWHYVDTVYRQTSNISSTFVDNNIVDHSDVVGASHVGTAPTISSFPTQHMASKDWAKATARRDEEQIGFGIVCVLYYMFYDILYLVSTWGEFSWYLILVIRKTFPIVFYILVMKDKWHL